MILHPLRWKKPSRGLVLGWFRGSPPGVEVFFLFPFFGCNGFLPMSWALLLVMEGCCSLQRSGQVGFYPSHHGPCSCSLACATREAFSDLPPGPYSFHEHQMTPQGGPFKWV